MGEGGVLCPYQFNMHQPYQPTSSTTIVTKLETANGRCFRGFPCHPKHVCQTPKCVFCPGLLVAATATISQPVHAISGGGKDYASSTLTQSFKGGAHMTLMSLLALVCFSNFGLFRVSQVEHKKADTCHMLRTRKVGIMTRRISLAASPTIWTLQNPPSEVVASTRWEE